MTCSGFASSAFELQFKSWSSQDLRHGSNRGEGGSHDLLHAKMIDSSRVDEPDHLDFAYISVVVAVWTQSHGQGRT